MTTQQFAVIEAANASSSLQSMSWTRTYQVISSGDKPKHIPLPHVASSSTWFLEDLQIWSFRQVSHIFCRQHRRTQDSLESWCLLLIASTSRQMLDFLRLFLRCCLLLRTKNQTNWKLARTIDSSLNPHLDEAQSYSYQATVPTLLSWVSRIPTGFTRTIIRTFKVPLPTGQLIAEHLKSQRQRAPKTCQLTTRRISGYPSIPATMMP